MRLFNGRSFLLLLAFSIFLMPCNSWAEKRHFEMTINTVKIKVNDKLTYTVFAFNKQVPGPLIHVKEGDEVTVKVTNMTALPHTVHWHGIYQKNNWKMDGVPGISQRAIKPGGSFTYKWIAEPTGSLWYHCHVNVNEHVAYRGMWGPIVIDPKNPTELEKRVTKDHILMFSSYVSAWADKPGRGGLPSDVPDFFALNGRSFPNTQPIRVKKGDVIRLRLYGAGGETHAIHTHGHHFTVTHIDGFPLKNPYRADTIQVGPANRYDIIIEANNPSIFIIHDHVDVHTTNNGKYPGGPITVIEYDGIEPQPFYLWKGIDYDPNFYYQESLTKGYGMFENDRMKGKSQKRRRRRK